MFTTVYNVAIYSWEKGALWFSISSKTHGEVHILVPTQVHILSELFNNIYYSKFLEKNPENSKSIHFLHLCQASSLTELLFGAQSEGLCQETNAVLYTGSLVLCLTSPQWHLESVGSLLCSGESLQITICLSGFIRFLMGLCKRNGFAILHLTDCWEMRWVPQIFNNLCW